MPSVLPDGDLQPPDGLLPASASAGTEPRNFGVYIHIPFCQVRCGYCDFNTYTATDMPGVSQGDFAEIASREIRFAKGVLAESGVKSREVSTVFFGGGTPTLLPPEHLAALLREVDASWGIAQTAEVTVEANPDTVTRASLETLASAGVTRMSFGVQSFVPHVLATLDRTHRPDGVADAVAMAKDLGLQVSLDLIYGTPGESLGDWKTTLERALELRPDHISAYSLIVEPGTSLARRIQRGELPPIDDDTQAEFYETADDFFDSDGLEWYEVSNWSRSPEARSRHNLGYWRGDDWWGVGPGAHSHVGGVRWWNVKHPKAYADRVHQAVSPGLAREVLDEAARQMENTMLRLRTRDGLARADVNSEKQHVVAQAIVDGLVDPHQALGGTLVLTRKGRLLADALARDLLVD